MDNDRYFKKQKTFPKLVNTKTKKKLYRKNKMFKLTDANIPLYILNSPKHERILKEQGRCLPNADQLRKFYLPKVFDCHTEE